MASVNDGLGLALPVPNIYQSAGQRRLAVSLYYKLQQETDLLCSCCVVTADILQSEEREAAVMTGLGIPFAPKEGVFGQCLPRKASAVEAVG